MKSRRILYSRLIFITGIVLLTSLSGLFIYETYQENSSTGMVYNKNAVVTSLDKIFLLLKQRESAVRGYALTKDSTLLKSAQSAMDLEAHFDRIDSLGATHADQQKNLKELRRLSALAIEKQDAVASASTGASSLATAIFEDRLKKSSSVIERIQALITNMQGRELALLRDQELDARKHTVLATIVGVAVSLFSMVIFIVAFYFIDQELKRSQHYLNETQNLNTKIAEINAALGDANRNLQQLNSELEGKNLQLEKTARELSSFTHITSHDMQEPLRKIEFYVSVAEDQEKQNLSEEGKKYLEKIKQSVSRMRKLFIGMLDFTLTNAVDNIIEKVDLNIVLQHTINSLKIYIKDTNASIECDGLPKVKGIKYQLIQLFENILSNAIKFRRKELIPEIRISYSIIHADGVPGLKSGFKYYRIDFKDNGIGFESRYAEKIFEIFQRLNTKTDSYGVGIGLAICRKIAENHAGVLTAASRPDEGSVFSLYIPVTNDDSTT